MPVPRTREALEILVENVDQATAALPVALALEHVASLVEWPDAELPEDAFVSELLERTGAKLLLDLANLHANACNHGGDPSSMLAGFPLDRLAYVHVAGGELQDGLYHDSHAARVPAEVLTLLSELCRLTSVPGVLLERDDEFPAPDALLEELACIQRATQLSSGPNGA